MSGAADRMRIARRAAEGSRRTQTAAAPAPADLIQISARITPDAHRGLRMTAARHNLSVAALVQVLGLLLDDDSAEVHAAIQGAAHRGHRQWGGRRTS